MQTQIELPGYHSETLPRLLAPLPKGHTRHLISEGTQGTAETIALMQQLVGDWKRDEAVRVFIGRVLNPENGDRPCDPKNYFCNCRKMYEAVRDQILYVYDPNMVEYLESPVFLLKTRIGDCDSMDILLTSIYESMGFETQFVTIMADDDRPNEYSHVYCRVHIPKYGWIVADPTMPKKWFGWQAEHFHQRKYWHGSTDALNMPLDTSDSVKIGSPEVLDKLGGGSTAGLSGLKGLKSLGQPVPSTSQPPDLSTVAMERRYNRRHKTHQINGLQGLGHGHHGGGGHFFGGGWGGGDGYPYWDEPQTVIVEQPILLMNTDGEPFTIDQATSAMEAERAGENSVPSAYPLGLTGLGQLGQNDDTTKQGIYDILVGNTLQTLHNMKAKIDEHTRQLDSLLASINQLPAGAGKTAAKRSYDVANKALTTEYTTYVAARSKYNDFIVTARTYAGTIPGLQNQLPGLAGLSDFGVSEMVVVIAGIAALSALAYTLTSLVAAWNGQVVNTDGLIQQAANAIKAAGGAIHEVGDTSIKLAGAVTNIAVIAGLGLLGWLAYEHRGDIKSAFGSRGRKATA